MNTRLLHIAAANCGAACLWPGLPAQAAGAEPPPLTLTLKLDIGGEVSGEVLDHSDQLIVIDYHGAPWAFAFDELQVASAYQAKKQLLIRKLPPTRGLSAEDHYQLGLYALSRDHPALANREFQQAQQLDSSYRDRVDRARAAHRQRPRAGRRPDHQAPLDRTPPTDHALLPGLTETVSRLDAPTRQRIIEAYKQFGQSVRRAINPDLVLLETEHFLIWTDWERHQRDRLPEWCERMYQALAVRFNVPADQNVFLGKCPVFCLRSKARFRRFARTYDNWKASNAVGYTRTDPTGHVHLVIYRRRTSAYEIDRFAGTLIHEGVHAFLHRYHRTFHISGWVGEGLANYIAEHVLGDRCLYGEQAELIARQYVKRSIAIRAILENPNMPAPHEYPVAHSLVGFLIQRDPTAFAAFIVDIKEGHTVEAALQRAYDGMDFAALETAWRESVRARDD